MIVLVFVACGGGSSSIIMTTTEANSVRFTLSGSGTATVDWGDGSGRVTQTFTEGSTEFRFNYPNTAVRTIRISGRNITGLSVRDNQLTSLDVSRNTVLRSLSVSNNQLTSLDVNRNTVLAYLNVSNSQLTSLDISRNTALTRLYVNHNQLTSLDVSRNTALIGLNVLYNQFTESALNALIGSLPPQQNAVIWIGGNPGTSSITTTTRNGWRIRR